MKKWEESVTPDASFTFSSKSPLIWTTNNSGNAVRKAVDFHNLRKRRFQRFSLSWLGAANNFAGIASFVTTIIFGWWGLKLTETANSYSRSSLKMAEKQDSLHEELNELRNLVRGQELQITKLVAISGGLEKQNELTKSEIAGVNVVTERLANQTNELKLLNKEQVGVSGKISKQFAITSGILQYILQKDVKKFDKLQTELRYAVGEVMTLQSTFIRYLTIDTNELKNPVFRDSLLNEISKTANSALEVMDRNSGNELLDHEMVSHAWVSAYNFFHRIKKEVPVYYRKSNLTPNELWNLRELVSRLAFMTNAEFNDLNMGAVGMFKDIFQIDTGLIHRILPSY